MQQIVLNETVLFQVTPLFRLSWLARHCGAYLLLRINSCDTLDSHINCLCNVYKRIYVVTVGGDIQQIFYQHDKVSNKIITT